ncbi:MAG: dihydroneopterin aldolase family protein, partial [Nitrososphaerales archaeon]|nr:dihydroneopterin aldolase family protein [Nitrososphaerales archaeon]
MKEGIESIVRKYFDQSLTDRERAIFEGGIALGALYHQFIGIPICRDRKVVSMLERAI